MVDLAILIGAGWDRCGFRGGDGGGKGDRGAVVKGLLAWCCDGVVLKWEQELSTSMLLHSSIRSSQFRGCGSGGGCGQCGWNGWDWGNRTFTTTVSAALGFFLENHCG